MVFNDPTSFTVFIVLIIWQMVLTILVLRAIAHYNRLTNGITTKTLREVMDAILRTVSSLRKNTDTLRVSVDRLNSNEVQYLQRIGVVRFNPFADTGGAQSFSIALLNKQKSGIVMTSLYARSGNRWYIKQIVEGKGKDLSLSKEEEEAIRTATVTGAAIL